MGKYGDIVNLIEKSAPEYTSLQVVPRGTPIFQDLLMTGEIRFARRTGANFAVLNPDNKFLLTAVGQVAQSILTVDKILPWLEEGALVTFNKTEMLEIQAWETSSKTIFLNEVLSAEWPVGSEAALWATPLVVHYDSLENTTQLFVRSRYQIVNGDAVTFPTSNTLNSLKQINVVKATYAGLDVDPNFPYIFVLDLESPLPISLLTGKSSCYLRAFPSYVSKVLSIPKLKSGQMGPFLLDFIASPLNSIPKYDETFSVRTFSAANEVIEGGANYYTTATHNYPIINRPIWAENMIFWKVVRGIGGFTLPNKFKMTATSQLSSGQYVARVSTRLVPPLKAGVRYDFKIRGQSSGTFIAIPYPYSAVQIAVSQYGDSVLTIETPDGGEPITRLDFIFKSDNADKSVTVSDASLPNDAIVSSFQYSYVFRVVGDTNFQATSVIVKPYFLSLNDLAARYDTSKNYNAGYIYL